MLEFIVHTIAYFFLSEYLTTLLKSNRVLVFIIPMCFKFWWILTNYSKKIFLKSLILSVKISPKYMPIVQRANKNMTALKHIHYLPTFSFSGDWWLDQWMMLLHIFSQHFYICEKVPTCHKDYSSSNILLPHVSGCSVWCLIEKYIGLTNLQSALSMALQKVMNAAILHG